MEAWKVKYGAMVMVDDENIAVPPDAIPVNNHEKITILRADGMYCNGSNANGDTIYIAAWTNVEPIS